MTQGLVWFACLAAVFLIIWIAGKISDRRYDDQDQHQDQGNEGYEEARRIAQEVSEEEKDTIDRAINAKDPEGALASLINKRGSPLE